MDQELLAIENTLTLRSKSHVALRCYREQPTERLWAAVLEAVQAHQDARGSDHRHGDLIRADRTVYMVVQRPRTRQCRRFNRKQNRFNASPVRREWAEHNLLA